MITRLTTILAFLVLLPIGFDAKAADPQPAMDAGIALRAYSALVDLEFENTRDALRIVAASENARSGNWARIKQPLLALAKGTPDSAAIWFARPDGSYFTTSDERTGQNLRDRSYFPRLAGSPRAPDASDRNAGKRLLHLRRPAPIPALARW